MSKMIHILIVEDLPTDAELCEWEVRKVLGSCEFRRAESREEYIAALESFKPEIIISDFKLPRFDGLSALKLALERIPDTPFIIITGSMNEDTAVECMKAGAWDYVIKEHIKRLGPAVLNALEQKRVRLERRKAEEALRESEERFRRLAENAQDLIYRYEFSPKRNFTYVSPAATAMTGYSPEEHYADPDLGFKLVHPDDRPLLEEYFQGRGMFSQPIVLRWIRKNGAVVWTEQINVPIYDDAGLLIALEGIARDVTERKQAEDRIRALLKEKEAMLREIHHRVKNNMQVISSLLNLQARKVMDEKLKNLLKESQSRIKSMALIHESFYLSEDMSRIDISDYIKKISSHLLAFYKTDTRQIRLKLDMEPVEVDINRAIPCGLILNELISNALKYAFPGNQEGTITISLHARESGKYYLSVKDSGVGFPEDLDFRNSESLGMQIVMDLVNQLDGSLELRREQGTEFVLQF